LFANIFLSDDLAERTRLQLLNYFKQSVEVELKEKKAPEKLISVATALLTIVRLENQLAMKVGTVASYSVKHATTQSASLTAVEHQLITDILLRLQTVEDDMLVRISAETFVYLNASRIIKSP